MLWYVRRGRLLRIARFFRKQKSRGRLQERRRLKSWRIRSTLPRPSSNQVDAWIKVHTGYVHQVVAICDAGIRSHLNRRI